MLTTILFSTFGTLALIGLTTCLIAHNRAAYLTRTRLELQQSIVDSKIADMIIQNKDRSDDE